MTHLLGCGTHSHDIECLCDVRIKESTPVRYDLLDVWQAKAIARALDYTGADDSNEAFAEFAQAMLDAIEATRMARAMKQGDDYEDRPALRRLALGWLKEGNSMLDIPALLSEEDEQDWSLAETVQLLTGNQTTILWRLDGFGWLAVEAAMEEDISHSEFCVRFGFERWMITTLQDWYGKSIRKAASGNRFDVNAQQRKKLIADNPGLRPRDYLKLITGEGLGEPSLTSIRHMIRRSSPTIPP